VPIFGRPLCGLKEQCRSPLVRNLCLNELRE
jgi:hypothetical protein